MQTITLPPRIEKQKIDAQLLTPCPAAPKPAEATPRLTAHFLNHETERADCNAWKLQRIGTQVDTTP